MSDAAPQPPPAEPQGFPFVTAAVTLVGLCLFAGLVLVAFYSPNYLRDGPAAEPKADPAAKLREVRAKNQALLDGTDTAGKLPVGRAADELIERANKSKTDKAAAGRLPFPVEPKAPPPAPEKK